MTQPKKFILWEVRNSPCLSYGCPYYWYTCLYEMLWGVKICDPNRAKRLFGNTYIGKAVSFRMSRVRLWFWGFYPNTKVSSAYEIVRFWQCDDLVWGYFSSVRIDLLAWGYFSSAVLRERERYNFRRWYQWVVSSVKIVTQLWMRSLHWGRVLSNATVIDTALVAMYW